MKDLKKNVLKKGGWFRYILVVEGLLIFSFIAAGLAVIALKDNAAPVETAGSPLKHLFRNYHIIRTFSELTPPAAPPTGLNGEITPDDPFLSDVIALDNAAALKDEKKMTELGAVLDTVKTKHPFIRHRFKPLYLKYLYSRGMYREYIGNWEEKLVNGSDVELPLLLMNCLIQTRNDNEAFEIFKRIFPRNRLAPFMQLLPRARLNVYLRRLDFNEWSGKFRFLLSRNRYTEFNREKAYVNYPQLISLFDAEFAYKQKKYTRARRFLEGVKDERLLPDKAKLLVKMDVRQEQYSEKDIDGILVLLRDSPTLYRLLLYDLGAIFSGKGETGLSLKYLTQYIHITRYTVDSYAQVLNHDSLPIMETNYWKAVWRTAWFYYGKKDKKSAAKYFKEGTRSHLTSTRIGSLYWLQRLDKRSSTGLGQYPFSYYYTKTNPDPLDTPQSLESFIHLLNQPGSKDTPKILNRVRKMVEYGLIDQARDYITWSLGNSLLNQSDKYVLALVKSLLYLKEGNDYLSFAGFRDHFDCYRCVRLPRFLAPVAFPLKYSNLIEYYSDEFELDPMLVYSLIRQESFFRADAISPANAHGLMQLLLQTARSVALKKSLRIYRRDLYNPETNIKLGTEFLKDLLKRYDGKIYLALAAYNAGPHRVDAWLQRFGRVPEDEFIEMIPFTETRNYVKKILRNYYYYKFYYGNVFAESRP